MAVRFGELTTHSGFKMDEVASAFQKCMQRNLESGV